MENEVQSVIGLASSGNDKTLVDGWLNDGVVDVLLRTECYVTSATMTETSGTGDYTLDTAMLIVKSLRWSAADGSSDSYPQRVPVTEIERLRAATSTTDTTSTPASAYAVNGSNLLMVWPTPTAADTITVYYVPRPTAMSSASHDPSNATYGGVPAEFHKAIVLYAKWWAGDFADDQSSAQGERYKQLYEDEIKRIRKYKVLHGGRLGRSLFRPSRRRGVIHNDQYPSWI